MGWQTIAGVQAADVEAGGIRNFAGALSAADLIASLRDSQMALGWAFVAGVVAGGVCTASGLNVTVPTATQYWARALWTANGAAVYAVPDNATTYLWGCSDGVVRQTAAYAPPTGFDTTTAVMLCRAIASGGVVTISLGLQLRARYGGLQRVTYEGWYQDNATASQTAAALARAGGAFGPEAIMFRAGWLTSMLVKCSNARTAGTLTAIVYKNGSATGLQAVLDGSATTFRAQSTAVGSIAVAQADQLDIRVTTDSAWAAGSTPKILSALEIMA